MTTLTLLFLSDYGASALVLLLGMMLLFFGAKRVLKLAQRVGNSRRELKRATQNIPTNREPADQAASALALPMPVLYPGYPHATYFASVA